MCFLLKKHVHLDQMGRTLAQIVAKFIPKTNILLTKNSFFRSGDIAILVNVFGLTLSPSVTNLHDHTGRSII